jgi:hypothetical protein
MAAADADDYVSGLQGLTEDRDASAKLSLRLSALEGDLQQQVQHLTQGADQLKVGAPIHATLEDRCCAREDCLRPLSQGTPISQSSEPETIQKHRAAPLSCLVHLIEVFASPEVVNASPVFAHFEKLG